MLCCIHINSTSVDVCAKLFDVDKQLIIDTLLEENLLYYKICSTCGKLFHYSQFFKDRNSTGGVSPICPNCHNINKQNYRKNNKERVSEYRKQYYNKNKEYLLSYSVNLRKRPDQIIKRKEWTKQYILKPEVRERRRELDRYRNKYNSKHRVSKHFRQNLAHSLSESKNGRHWESLVGYTLTELMEHLEFKFQPGMTWDNYGTYWVIDHIVPIKAFHYTKTSDIDFINCWSLENLQPLEKTLNSQKSDIISEKWNNIELAKKFNVLG